MSYIDELNPKYRLGLGDLPFVKATKGHAAALQEACAEVDRLRSENEALKADRERLDWLEQNNWGVATRSNREYQVKHDKLDFAAPTAPEIRVAIDMARSEGEKTT